MVVVLRSEEFLGDTEFRKKIVKKAGEALKEELDSQTRDEIENLRIA